MYLEFSTGPCTTSPLLFRIFAKYTIKRTDTRYLRNCHRLRSQTTDERKKIVKTLAKSRDLAHSSISLENLPPKCKGPEVFLSRAATASTASTIRRRFGGSSSSSSCSCSVSRRRRSRRRSRRPERWRIELIPTIPCPNPPSALRRDCPLETSIASLRRWLRPFLLSTSRR